MSLDISDEDLKEFNLEALELLESAEDSLLAMDGGDFDSNYDAVFRAFHSIKGGAGMCGFTPLQEHMHKLENLLTPCKTNGSISSDQIDFFLRGVDGAKKIIQGETIEFVYEIGGEKASGESESESFPSSVENKAEEAKVEAARAEPEKTTCTTEDVAVSPSATQGETSVNSESYKGTVLIIDDEPDVVEIITDMVQDAGFRAVGFTNPKEALSQLRKVNPDVVLTDFSMPQMDGMAVLNAVHKIDFDLPVVYVSGHVTKELLVKSITAGIYGVLEKPFEENQVVQICVHAARKSQLTKLLNKSINLVLYQFSDVDDYLRAQGKKEIRATMNRELNNLLEQRRQLRSLSK